MKERSEPSFPLFQWTEDFCVEFLGGTQRQAVHGQFPLGVFRGGVDLI
jgi:hypothetical protein